MEQVKTKKSSKIKIDREKCKGCGLCIIVCPKKSIELSKDINSYGYYPAVFIDKGECTGCTFCALTCPDVAIEVYKEE